jgi:hypothetical protein
VGVASNSHKAIDNVLHAVEDRFIEEGKPIGIVGQKKDSAERFEKTRLHQERVGRQAIGPDDANHRRHGMNICSARTESQP